MKNIIELMGQPGIMMRVIGIGICMVLNIDIMVLVVIMVGGVYTEKLQWIQYESFSKSYDVSA